MHHAAMVVIAAVAERDRHLWPERDAGTSPLETESTIAGAEGRRSAPVDAGASTLGQLLSRTAQGLHIL